MARTSVSSCARMQSNPRSSSTCVDAPSPLAPLMCGGPRARCRFRGHNVHATIRAMDAAGLSAPAFPRALGRSWLCGLFLLASIACTSTEGGGGAAGSGGNAATGGSGGGSGGTQQGTAGGGPGR